MDNPGAVDRSTQGLYTLLINATAQQGRTTAMTRYYNHNAAIHEAAGDMAYELGLNHGRAAIADLVALRTAAVSMLRSRVVGYPYVVARRIDEAFLEGVSLSELEVA
jgi:hypothetical protein